MYDEYCPQGSRYVLRTPDFLDNPSLMMRFVDHQSYEKPGGVWILRDSYVNMYVYTMYMVYIYIFTEI